MRVPAQGERATENMLRATKIIPFSKTRWGLLIETVYKDAGL